MENDNEPKTVNNDVPVDTSVVSEPVSSSNDVSTPPSEPSTPDTTPAPADVPPTSAFVSPPPKKNKKKLMLVLLLVLLLGAGAAAYMMMNREDTAPVAQSTQNETKEVEVIRIGSTDGPANNLFPKEGIGVSYSQGRQVYEGLVGEQDKKYVPLLATSWTNPDEKTWVFKLKPGVKFHSGKTMTATDVKRSLEALKKLDFLGYLYATIGKVEVVSDLEVKITTTEPDALLLNRLALSYISDQDALKAEGNNGTGPYTLDKTATYDEKTATFVAYDGYHQGRPKTRKLVYNIYADDAKMNEAIKAKSIDQMETIPSDKAVAGLSEAGFAKIEYESPGTFGLYMNMLRTDSPLKKKEVRTALAQALNRKALVDELDLNNQAATQVVPKSLPGYDANLAFPAFNVTTAKETLKKAGYPNGVTLEYLYIDEVQPDPPIVIKQLEAAGFKINAIKYTEVDPLLDKVFAGEFDLFSAAYTSDLADSRDILGALLESTEQSYPVLKDPAYDKLLQDSDEELDPTKRIAILQAANKYITDNVLWIPLRSTVYVSYFKPELAITHDYNGGGTLGVYYWRVGQKPAS